MDEKERVVIYADGSAKGNKGGWAHVKEAEEDSGIDKVNCMRMEMEAVLEAMRSVRDKSVPVEIKSDSEVVIKTMNGEYGFHANEDLWEEMFKERDLFPEGGIKFTHVRVADKDQGREQAHKAAHDKAVNA